MLPISNNNLHYTDVHNANDGTRVEGALQHAPPRDVSATTCSLAMLLLTILMLALVPSTAFSVRAVTEQRTPTALHHRHLHNRRRHRHGRHGHRQDRHQGRLARWRSSMVDVFLFSFFLVAFFSSNWIVNQVRFTPLSPVTAVHHSNDIITPLPSHPHHKSKVQRPTQQDLRRCSASSPNTACCRRQQLYECIPTLQRDPKRD